MKTPGQRCDDIIRLIEEALDGAPPAYPAPAPVGVTSSAVAPSTAQPYGRR